MRLRNIKNKEEILNNSKYIILNPKEYKGKWNNVFKNNNPIYIEIGMGKGKFILENALKYPNINFIGIEKYDSVIARAIKKIDEREINNLKLIRIDANELNDVFDKEIDLIYLTFSDPWPKDRHAKRRLTSTRFLERYDNILTPEGRVMFKTDNKDLFDFSLEQVEEAGWILENHTYDLHHSEYNEGNVMTEYEEKFSAKGNPICRLVAYRHAK